MSRRLMVLVGVLAGLTGAAPAVAASPLPGSVTATGTKLVQVRPTDRNRNSSIQAAVAAAQKAGIDGALASARSNAVRYAKAAGLTLGTIVSVSDVQNNGGGFFSGPYGPGGFFGPFGPDQYCGIERRPVFKIVNHRHKLVRLRKIHACIVPRYETTTLTVTYNAQ